MSVTAAKAASRTNCRPVAPDAPAHGRVTSRKRRQRLPAGRFLFPALLLFGGVFIVPFLGGLPLSFSNWNGITRFSFNGLANFRNLLKSAAFGSALEHNAIMVGAFFVLINVVGLGLALLINQRPFGYRVYRALIFLPFMMSLVATGFIWEVLLDPQIGIVNPWLKDIGLTSFQPQWLDSPHLALAVVIVVTWWQWGGVAVVIYGAGLNAIPMELMDAAKVDGAVGWSRFRLIVMPLLRPAVVITTILAFVTSMQAFAVTDVMEGIQGAPAGATDVLGTLIYRVAFGSGTQNPTSNLGYAETNAVAMMILLGCGLLLLQLYFRRRMVEL